MSFEEDYPGLATTQMRLFTQGEVKKYCLDKQRVKEEITSLQGSIFLKRVGESNEHFCARIIGTTLDNLREKLELTK